MASKGEVHIGFWYRKPEGNTTLGRPGRRMEDNIKMDLKGIVCEDMDWTDMAHGNDKWWAVDKKSLVNSGLDKMSGTSWPAEKLAACQKWLSHGVSQPESELYKSVVVNCNICKQKLFLIQLKLKFPQHLSRYVEGTAQCLISHVTFWAKFSFSDPQTGSTLRKTKTVRKVRSCSMNSYIQKNEHQQLAKCTEFVRSVCRNFIILFVLVNAVIGSGLQQTE